MLREDDAKLLKQLVRDVGRKNVARIFLMMGGCGDMFTERQRQTVFKLGVSPLRLMRDLLRDYTEQAVLDGFRPRKRKVA